MIQLRKTIERINRDSNITEQWTFTLITETHDNPALYLDLSKYEQIKNNQTIAGYY